MKEAVEICKLRLFLKLASELKQGQKIEALPDIDFNIRAGNSLIGYTSATDMENAIKAEEGELKLDDRTAEIRGTVQELAEEFNLFRKKQTEWGGKVKTKDKKNLRDKLQEFVDRLDRFLAQDYKVKIKVDEDITDNEDFQDWREQVQPFHWWAEFHDIIDKHGTGEDGFDVIVGNPPFLEAARVKYSPNGFKTKGTIQGYFVEQSNKILSRKGGMSMVFPMALVSSKRMKAVQDIIETDKSAWYSNYSSAPAKLFDGVDIDLTIFISASSQQKEVFTTGYKKWAAKAREALMPTLTYVPVLEASRKKFWIPKFQDLSEIAIFDKVTNQQLSVGEIWGHGSDAIYYRGAGGRYWKVFTDFRPKFFINGVAAKSSTQESKFIKKEYDPVIVAALLSSSIFWWWYTIGSDCWHLTGSHIESFKTSPDIFNENNLRVLGKEYLADIEANSYLQTSRQQRRGTIQTQQFKIKKSKSIIDKIDAVLSRHYDFTAEELDFIQSYDIKFRVGVSEADED